MKRRDFLRVAALCGGGAALEWNVAARIAHAKEIYPEDKIKWIIFTEPGGIFDIIPRAISPFMTKYIKQSAPGCKGGGIVMSNEPAGGGIVALTHLFKADPDGYTIGGMDSSYITGTVVASKANRIKFDLAKFTYLVRFGSTEMKVVVTNKNGYKSWDEAVKASNKLPLKIAVGKFGGMNHLAGMLIKDALKLNAKVINSKGSSDTLALVIRGDADVGVFTEDTIGSLIESKELRVLLTLNDAPQYPGVASLNQLGYPEFSELSSGQRFVVGPPGLPREVTTLLINALKKTFEDKEFMDWAKKGKYKFTPIYGDDASKLVNKYIATVNKNKDILAKYLE
jgi:tripartite-type tricarboxylate transporter receptor subunit TctC